MGKRRDRLGMIVAVLDSIGESERGTFTNKDPLPKTVLAARVGLNPQIFDPIADLMVAQGLAETIPLSRKRVTYRLTARGKEWLKNYRDLINILEVPL